MAASRSISGCTHDGFAAAVISAPPPACKGRLGGGSPLLKSPTPPPPSPACGGGGTAMSRPSLLTACAAMLRRDLTLAWRRRGDIAMPVLYALIVTMLFPFALGPED